MKRLLALTAALTVLLTSVCAESWISIPSSLRQSGWLLARTDPLSEEMACIASVDPPAGYVLTDDTGTRLVYTAQSLSAPVRTIRVTACEEAVPATDTDLDEFFTLRASGQTAQCVFTPAEASSGQTARLVCILRAVRESHIKIELLAADAYTDRYELQDELRAMLASLRLSGFVSGMPAQGVDWESSPSDTASVFGDPVYTTDLAEDGWTATETVAPCYGADVAEIDCIFRDQKLVMILVGMEALYEDTQSSLTETYGAPGPADAERAYSALRHVLDIDKTMLTDCPCWETDDAEIFLIRWGDISLVLCLDPLYE